MEEESRTIATRLRRRLSVETDDVSSPSAPSTPTKKRVGRLAAKPVLDNIDENVPVSSPRTTRRRSAVKDLVEEDKAITPSKRNTRVRSNTSITLETAQTDSPRARRAARRNSVAGSDPEAPITPVRQTRRTRKDSTSSVENTDMTKPMIQISEETIKEEPEALKSSNNLINEDLSPNSLRKSQRIASKKDRNSLNKSDTESNTSLKQDKNKCQSKDCLDQNNAASNDSKVMTKNTPDVIKELDDKPSNKNPSRRRAKSLTNDSSEDQSFLEAKESVKTKGNRSFNNISDKESIASGASTFQTNVTTKSKELGDKENVEITNSSSNELKGECKAKSLRRSSKITEIVDGEDNVDHSSQKNSQIDATTEFLTLTNNDDVKVKILMEDTDSNSERKENYHDVKSNRDDQCVPVVNANISSSDQPPKEDEAPKLNVFTKFSLNKSRDKKSSINISCEPMDIDETIPENVSFLDNSDKNIESKKSDVVNTDIVVNTSQINQSILGNKMKLSFSSDKSISKIKEKLRKSKTPSISEDERVIKSPQSIANAVDEIDNSINHTKKGSMNSNGISISDDNSILDTSKCITDIHDKTSDKSLSQLKRARISKTPSSSEDNKIEKSQNISVFEIKDTTTKSKTSSISEDNKLTDSLLYQSITDKSMDKSISQLNKSRKSKTSSVSEETNKSTVVLLSKSEKILDKSAENPLISEDERVIKSPQSIANAVDEIDNSINHTKKGSMNSNGISISDDNSILDTSKCITDIHDKTSDKSLSQLKRASISKTPSSSKDNKIEKSQNISVFEIKDTTTKSKTSSISEDNKLTDSLLYQSITDKSMDKSISQLNKSRKSKTSSVSEETNKSTVVLLSKSEKILDKSAEKSKKQSICLEKTTNDNKSTLILSQLKDASDMDINKSQKHTTKDISLNMTEFSERKADRNVYYNEDKTPLKNKKVHKLGMKTSTPVLSAKNQQLQNVDSSKSSHKSSNSLSSSNEIDSDARDSDEDSNESLLDDQAEDGGDDYESGDSQNESERRYEEENEILERGETLTSDEDVSDDTDYEKDSFVVSSDEEDNNLLSGSGDNLSMSDNELTMSAKSKKKFNDRMLKEQRNASREMFEARHGKKIGLDESSNVKDTIQVPKNNKKKKNSTVLKSGDESIIKPKKNKQRLNSSASLKSDAEESIIRATNNRFRLDSSDLSGDNGSELVSRKNNSCNENFDDAEEDEKEITTFMNGSIIQNKDPLITAIKSENFSPKKLNISTANISVRPDVEEIHVMENASFLHDKETSDPLQATTLFDADDDDSSSENEEIMHNYDSMLSELNNQRKHNKSHDILSNLSKKNKLKSNPLIDQPNLTQTKKEKICKTSQQNESNKTISNNPDSESVNEDSSSSSLDINLLFPEDSDNNDEKVNNSKLTEDLDFIPLKRTEAKTNLQSKATPSKNTKTLSESKDEEEIINVSLIKTPRSTTKNKKVSVSSFNENNAEISNVTTPDGKKKTSKSSICIEIEHTDTVHTETLFLKTPGSKKKKNKKVSVTINDDTDLHTTETIKEKNTVSESLITTATTLDRDNSFKKKKKSISSSEPLPQDEIDSNGAAYEITSSGKKKKKTSESLVAQPTETESNELMPMKRKRKSSTTAEVIDADGNTQQTKSLAAGSQKKKLKISKQDKPKIDLGPDIVQAEITESNSFVENKKNKKYRSEKQDGLEILKSKSLKRKERGDDDSYKKTKIFKENYSDSLHISRLPINILDQLQEKSKSRTGEIVSTIAFKVEEMVKRKNKPSHYLEESICLNSTLPKKKRRVLKDKPKVLPFMPTASTSESGFTTNFQINVISHETKFVAQANTIPNFKRDYINAKTIKKMGTYEMYRKQRNVKLSKF